MLIVSDLIDNGIKIIESLKKRNKDFSKEIHLIIDLQVIQEMDIWKKKSH